MAEENNCLSCKHPIKFSKTETHRDSRGKITKVVKIIDWECLDMDSLAIDDPKKPPCQGSKHEPRHPDSQPKTVIKPAKQKPVLLQDKPGRNQPCPCKSGKKYKKCCGR